MKNVFKVLGISVLAALIVFSMAGCGSDGDNSSPPGLSVGSVAKIELKDSNTSEYAYGYCANFGLNPATFYMFKNGSPWLIEAKSLVVILHRYATNITWNGMDYINLSGDQALESYIYTNNTNLENIGTGITDEASYITNFSSIPEATFTAETDNILMFPQGEFSKFRRIR